jgi:diguanylate cyclase (GGDEF)-like protein
VPIRLADTEEMPDAISLRQYDARVRGLPDLLLLAVALVVIAALCVLQVTEGTRISIAEFFLVPVAAVGWFAGSLVYGVAAALIATAAAAGVTLYVDPRTALTHVLAAAAARLILYLVVLVALRAMRRLQAEHEREALIDPVTRTANARGFRARAAGELERSRRYPRPLSLLYVDIDDFKAVNDRFGHEAGDKVLGDVGHALRCTVRTVDTVGRLGGDEFAVLMPEASAVAASVAAERFRSELTRLTTPDGQAVRCSIGVATFARPPGSVTELMQAADQLMYAAKAGGKDRVAKADLGSGSPATPDAGV